MYNIPYANEYRILIVDDNPDIHNDFREILDPQPLVNNANVDALDEELFGEPITEVSPKASFKLSHAQQGQAGLKTVEQSLADESPFAVAFVDMRMPPGWDGLETIERIWKVDPYIQVVICTAYADYELDEITERLGITDNLFFLKKPFDSVEVAQLANALSVKWELTKIMEINMHQMEQTLEEQKQELKQVKTTKPKIEQ